MASLQYKQILTSWLLSWGYDVIGFSGQIPFYPQTPRASMWQGPPLTPGRRESPRTQVRPEQRREDPSRERSLLSVYVPGPKNTTYITNKIFTEMIQIK